MTSQVVRQELIMRINHLLESATWREDNQVFPDQFPDGEISLQVNVFDLFVLLNDLSYAKHCLRSRSPVELSFRGRRLGDSNLDMVWVLPQYSWSFPVPKADLEVESE